MAKNRQNRKKTYHKVDSMQTSFSIGFGKVVKILVAVFVFFIIFYFLIIFLIVFNTSSATFDTTPAEADIQYQEILAGNSFSISDNQYYVLYYDMSDDSLKSLYTGFVSSYEDKEEHLPIYTVDMSSTFNKKFVSSESNKQVSQIDELQISGPTLIEFNNHEVVNYIEGESAIKEILS